MALEVENIRGEASERETALKRQLDDSMARLGREAERVRMHAYAYLNSVNDFM